jgi:hypothetical protein
MFSLKNTIVNQFGLEVTNFLSIKDVNYTSTTNTYLSAEDSEPSASVYGSVHYSVVSYVSEEAISQGHSPMPLALLLDGEWQYSFTCQTSTELAPEDLILFCQEHFLTLVPQ